MPPSDHDIIKIKEEGGLNQRVLKELARAIRRRRCVLLMGLALVEEELQRRDRKEILEKMVQWCVKNKLIAEQGTEDDFRETLAKKTLEQDELNRLELRLRKEYFTEDAIQDFITETLLEYPTDIEYMYCLLAQMSFRAYLTTGYDKLLEKASENVKTHLKKYNESSIDEALFAYEMEESFILKLDSDTSKIMTLSSQFAKSQPLPIFYPPELRKVLADVNTLFIGFTTTDPDLEGLKSTVNKKDELNRWLLIKECHIGKKQAKELWTDDKVTTLSYTDLAELKLFLRKLAEEVATPQLIKVYLSYAPEDNEVQKRLRKHLDIIEYPGLEVDLKDGTIGPGQEQKQIIEKHLQEAQVILLLVSVDYLTSVKSNIKLEIAQAVQRHHREEARVIPIVVKSCLWKYAPFANLEVLPLDKIPIDRAINTDEALVGVAEAIKAAIEEWAEKH